MDVRRARAQEQPPPQADPAEKAAFAAFDRGAAADTAGRYDEARTHYRRALELSQQLWPNDPARLNGWQLKPSGTEGYRTAEVTLGGVSTDDVSSKTMEAKQCPGLFFIGEVLDVSGHLGGFNFQWAWSSGYTAGQFV